MANKDALTFADAAPSRRLDPDAVRHEDDVHLWARQQADWMRAGRFDRLDRDRLADEIEDVGRSELRSLRSHLSLILAHILKWDHQPARRSWSWALTIKAQRVLAVRDLRDNPSLRAKLDAIIVDAYAYARVVAETDTGLAASTFPDACPYSADDIFDRADVVAAPGMRDRPETSETGGCRDGRADFDRPHQ